MREIKFRGKRLDNGEWIVGSYIEAENRDRSIAHQIIHFEFRTNEQATVVINKFATKDGRESVRNILNCLNDLKVIGNIHDNPELMKGGDQ